MTGTGRLAAACEPSSFGTWVAECAGWAVPCHVGSYFPDQGFNLRPLHWKVDSFYFFSLNLLFCVRIYLINHVVVISGEQWRDSAIHIRVSILPQTPLLSRLAHNRWAEFHVLYSRSLLVIHFKCNRVYMTFPKSLTIPFPPAMVSSFSKSVSLFCSVSKFTRIIF